MPAELERDECVECGEVDGVCVCGDSDHRPPRRAARYVRVEEPEPVVADGQLQIEDA